jgi:hypothetical protein
MAKIWRWRQRTEAVQQKSVALRERANAVLQKQEATSAKDRADSLAKDAVILKDEAITQRDLAERQRKEAEHQRTIGISQGLIREAEHIIWTTEMKNYPRSLLVVHRVASTGLPCGSVPFKVVRIVLPSLLIVIRAVRTSFAPCVK